MPHRNLPILSHGTHNGVAVVRVQPPNTDKAQYFVPAKDASVNRLFAVDEHRVIVGTSDYYIVLYDLREKKIVARQRNGSDRFKVIDDDHIWAASQYHISILETETLMVLASVDHVLKQNDGTWKTSYRQYNFSEDAYLAQKRICFSDWVQTEKGPIVLSTRNTVDTENAPKVPILRLSPDLSSVEVEEVEMLEKETLSDSRYVTNPLRWISPSGRFALRPSWQPTYFPEKNGSEAAVPYHPDYDGEEALGLSLEIWSLEERAEHLRDIVVLIPRAAVTEGRKSYHRWHPLELERWTLHTNHGAQPVSWQYWDNSVRENDRLTSDVTTWHRNVGNILWEPEERGFWVFSVYGQFRRIGLDGSIGPLFTLSALQERQNEVIQEGRLPRGAAVSMLEWSDTDIMTVKSSAVGRFDIDVSEIRLSTQPTTLEIKPVRQNHDLREDHQKEFAKCVRTFLAPHVVLRDFTVAEVQSALTKLIELIENDFDSLTSGGLISLRGKLGRKALTEEAFFERIVSDNMKLVVPELRQLLYAYCSTTPEKEELYWWRNDHEGAFIPALHALLSLDVNSKDILRFYFYRCDAEHEQACQSKVFATLHSKTGWANKEDIRTAISLMVMRRIGGFGDWEDIATQTSLADNICAIVSKQEAWTIIQEEIANHSKWRQLGPEQVAFLEAEFEERLVLMFD